MRFAALLAAAVLAPAVTQALDDADTKEIAAYQLTDAAFAKYTQATRGLGALAKSLPAVCDDDDSAQSLTGIAAKMDAVPGVKAAIQAAGMTSREYLVFSVALLQAGLVASLQQPGAQAVPGVNMANVGFFRSHKAAIDALGAVKQPQCNDDDDRN
jgi:hypothetical protein